VLYPMTTNTKKKRKRFMMIDLQKKVEKALVTRKQSPINNNWLIK
jgi:hypothetical protein